MLRCALLLLTLLLPCALPAANLRLVGADPQGDTMRHAGRLRSDLRYGHIDEILATGLHAFLTQFLDRVNQLGAHISRDFLVPSLG